MDQAVPQLASAERLLRYQHQYREAHRRSRWRMGVGLLLVLGLVLLASAVAEVAPAKWWANLGNFTSYLHRITLLDSGQSVLSDPVEWFWGLKKWLLLMGETLLMAYVGTLMGAVGALLLCFMASSNLTRSKSVVFATRRLLEFARTVPEIVFALIFVAAFSLGPMPGVLALAIHTLGALGKLFAEVVENIDMKPVQGVVASGANWVQKVRFAALPQVLPNLLSYTLLRFEINVRGASVLGFVGAGGIGETLITSIRKFYYSDVSALLVLIILTVMIIDTLTEKLRHHLLGKEARV
jgi:phosphonate transport system permease protein